MRKIGSNNFDDTDQKKDFIEAASNNVYTPESSKGIISSPLQGLRAFTWRNQNPFLLTLFNLVLGKPRSISLIFLHLLLLVNACEFGQTEKEQAVEIEEQPIAKFVDYKVVTINEDKGPCVTDSTAQNCLTFRIEYPRIKSGLTNEEALNAINGSIKSSIFDYAFVNNKPTSFEQLIEELKTEYNDVLSSFPDYKASWSIEINSDIIYQDSSFVSIATTIFSYTGGAHANSSQVYKSFNLNTGEAITLDDILVKGYEEELNESAEIEFRMLKEIPPAFSLEEKGYVFEGGKFKLNDNFAIINKSLLFYYNPYEIASYAEGPTEIELRLTDYVNLIDANGILHAIKN